MRKGFTESCSAAELLCLVQPMIHVEGPRDARAMQGIKVLQENMPRFSEPVSKMIFQALYNRTEP